MEKWLKRKDPGDPPTPNKKSSVAASVAINNVEKSRPLKKPSPPSVTTTTVMPLMATMTTVLPPNSLHLILPRKKVENRRGTSSNSILNGTSTNFTTSTSTSTSISISISSVPAAMSSITPSVLTMGEEAMLKPIGSVIQAAADKSGVVARNVQREVVGNISVQRHVASAGSSLSLSSVQPLQSLPTSKIDTLLKNRLDARLGKSEIQTRATPSFLPFAEAQRSTILHNQGEKEKQKEKGREEEKERKVADQSQQYANEGQVGGVASSRAEQVAARGMDVPLGKGKGMFSAMQQSERRVLSERNDRQADDIVLSDSSDDEGGAVNGSRGRGRGRAVSEVKNDAQQHLHEISDLPPYTADNMSEKSQPSSVDVMGADRSADLVVETTSTSDCDNHSASHSASDGHTGAGNVIDDDCVIVQALAHKTFENGMIGFEEARVERIPDIRAWTGLTAQEQEREQEVRGEVEGDGEGEREVEINEDTITAWDDEQDEGNNGGLLLSGSPGCTTTSTATVLDLTLTPAHIPGTLGSHPIGAEDILSDLIAIRQQTLDDFIIAGGQKIKRAAAYARNVPYPFIRDPAHYCGPMKFLNRISFQGKVR